MTSVEGAPGCATLCASCTNAPLDPKRLVSSLRQSHDCRDEQGWRRLHPPAGAGPIDTAAPQTY